MDDAGAEEVSTKGEEKRLKMKSFSAGKWTVENP